MAGSAAPTHALQAEAAGTQPLFPTFVWQTQLTPEATRAVNTPMLAHLDALCAGRPARQRGRTFQTAQDLHEAPPFQGFVGLLKGALDGVLDFLKVADRRLVITGCWANLGAPGDGHTPHTHPNNFLSGVYYLSAPPGANRIVFDDPRPQTYVVLPRVSEVTVDNGSFVNVTVTEGALLVFPAWLQHRVPPNESGLDRISVSFNAMFAD